jgi:hypothetical protein
MSLIVHAAQLDSAELTAVVDELWQDPEPRAILEGDTLVRLADGGELLVWGDWPRGRIFDERMELRWDDGDGRFEAILALTDGRPAPTAFAPVMALESGACVEHREWYYLWGEGDQAIGGRLRYSHTLPGEGRAQVGVARYTDATGRMVYHRYFALRREPGDGGKTAN